MRHFATVLFAPLGIALVANGCAPERTVSEEAANSTEELSVHAFSCVTSELLQDGNPHELTFSVVGLDSPDFDEDFVWPDDEGDDGCPGCPVKVTPADSPLVALNENGVVGRADGKLLVEGDADGFYWVTLALFENSGYTKGYVRIEDSGGYVEEHYSEVSCTVTAVDATPAQDLSGIVGIYNSFDHDYEVSGPLMVALYPGSQPLPEGYDGHVDLSWWDADLEDTHLTRGWFSLDSTEGDPELAVVDQNGEPLAGGTWTIVDGHLQVEGVSMYAYNRLDPAKYLEQCYALHVLEYAFEEGFTPYEYPMVDVSIDEGGHYEVGFGAADFEHSEAAITVGNDDEGNFEATVKTEWSTYVLRIPASSPRRGEVLFEQDGELQLMAHLGCF